jgi:hypothetical protein
VISDATGASVLLLAHSNRADDGSLRNRVGATGALRQKARVLLYAAQPPEEPGTLYIGADKANGMAKAEAIAYQVEVRQERPATEDDPGTTARLRAVSRTDATMEQHYGRWRAEARRSERPTVEDKARAWLPDYIEAHGIDTATGRQVLAADAKEAAKAADINPRVLPGVVKALGGYVGAGGAAGAPWVYRLPHDQRGHNSQSSQSRSLGERGETARETANPTASAAEDTAPRCPDCGHESPGGICWPCLEGDTEGGAA